MTATVPFIHDIIFCEKEFHTVCTSDVSEVKFHGSAEAEAEAEVSFSKNADADVVAEVMESFFAEAEAEVVAYTSAEAEAEPIFFNPFTVPVLRRQ